MTAAMEPTSARFARRSIGPLLADWLCVAVFVALGKENHGTAGAVAWYLTVWWPLAVGFVVGGLITRVYTLSEDWPARVLGTVLIAVLVGGPLRALTGRPVFSTFSLVAIVVLSIFTIGWRSGVLLVQRWKAIDAE